VPAKIFEDALITERRVVATKNIIRIDFVAFFTTAIAVGGIGVDFQTWFIKERESLSC
jgi:hypothetical protein